MESSKEFTSASCFTDDQPISAAANLRLELQESFNHSPEKSSDSKDETQIDANSKPQPKVCKLVFKKQTSH